MAIVETNAINKIGIVPFNKAGPIPVGKIPDGATQFALSGTANNNVVTLHTVNFGMVFYLSYFSICLLANDPLARLGNLSVQNAVPVLQYNIFRSYVWDYFGVATTGSFTPPLEIPAGWDIYIQSNHVNCVVEGFIHGYEI